MKTLLVTFIFAVTGIPTAFSVTKDELVRTPAPLTANEFLTAIKVHLQAGAKLIGVSDASVKKIIEIIDLELPESVLAPLYNQTLSVLEKTTNRIIMATVIEKSIPEADVNLLKAHFRKVIETVSALFVKKS